MCCTSARRARELLQAAVAIGIGLGSLAAGYLSSGKVEYGLIPLGSVGMTVFGMFAFGAESFVSRRCSHCWRHWASSAGFFAVPVNALIQHRPDEKDKGGVIAAANLLSFVGIGAAAGIYYVFQHYHPSELRPTFFWRLADDRRGDGLCFVSAA